MTARPYACELRYSKNLAIPRLIFTSIEMITFYGDCSFSSKFMRESGDYYRVNKERIDYEIKNASKVKNKNFDNLFSLARIFNCPESVNNHFAELIIAKKESIFGLNYEKNPKEVMINIQDIINEDSSLVNSCTK